MRIVYETALLTTSPSPSRDNFWQGRVLEEEGEFFTQALWWSVRRGKESRRQESTPHRIDDERRQGDYIVDAERVAIRELEAQVEDLQRRFYYTVYQEAANG